MFENDIDIDDCLWFGCDNVETCCTQTVRPFKEHTDHLNNIVPLNTLF
jgi:hypothetical protein